MIATLKCQTCDGYRKVGNATVGMKTCPDCDGNGRVPDHTARENLAAAAGVHFGGRTVEAFLEWIDTHRDLVADWMRETGFLNLTIYGLEPTERDPNAFPWSRSYVPVGTRKVVDRDHRISQGAAPETIAPLFTVLGADQEMRTLL